jgi:hypothetical protein
MYKGNYVLVKTKRGFESSPSQFTFCESEIFGISVSTFQEKQKFKTTVFPNTATLNYESHALF